MAAECRADMTGYCVLSRIFVEVSHSAVPSHLTWFSQTGWCLNHIAHIEAGRRMLLTVLGQNVAHSAMYDVLMIAMEQLFNKTVAIDG